MKIEKNRIVINLGMSCNYCNTDWGFMIEEADYDNKVYLDPEDNSVVCSACHNQYGSAGSKVEAE